MHQYAQFYGQRGARINGVWNIVTRWRIGGDGGYRIIEVFSHMDSRLRGNDQAKGVGDA